MIILVNTTNLSSGGGLQVADSFCKTLNTYTGKHHFIVVLSSYLKNTGEYIKGYENVEVFFYDITNSLSTLILGRGKFLDNLVKEKNVDMVFTVFGPSRWNPKVKHLSGFAMSQIVMKESPFYTIINAKQKLKWFIGNRVRKYLFKRSTNLFYTENKEITRRLQLLFKKAKCYTVTNYYNQIYDNPSLWKPKTLPQFDGYTFLTISTYYDFKNLTISIPIAKILKQRYKDLKFRFVFTCKESAFPQIDSNIRDNFLFIDTVDIEECPSLYEQCDIVFQPTLMECFTAVYPEAMKMNKPILTVDLPFATGLCGKAAEYYSPLSPEDAADKIYSLLTNEEKRETLIAQGKEQLKSYDNYTQRSEKIINIMEKEFLSK